MIDPFIRVWPGADRPALALHCMMGSGLYWGPIAKSLDDLVTVTAPDMLGHGKSDDWDGGPPDFHTAMTRKAAALINRPVDLIGHSIGATIALRIAVAAPEAVRSLTLIEPVLFAAAKDSEHDARMAQIAADARTARASQAAKSFIDLWGGLPWNSLTAKTQERLTRQISLVADTSDTLGSDAANLLREGGLEGIDAPVLIIMGAGSPPVIARIADALAERLPDVGRATVPEAGHMLPMTHPIQVADLIRLNLERA